MIAVLLPKSMDGKWLFEWYATSWRPVYKGPFYSDFY